MPVGTTSPLTPRQQDVMERIDCRVPIKVIAQELGLSETRINQHIRALKDIYGAASLNDLVRLHREATGGDDRLADGAEAEGRGPDDEPDTGLPETSGGKQGEPQIVPALLDGRHAIPLRLVAIMAIALAVLLASSLIVTGTVLATRAFAGKALVREAGPPSAEPARGAS